MRTGVNVTPLISRYDVEVERGHWYALGLEFINAGASWLLCVEDWAVGEVADESRVLLSLRFLFHKSSNCRYCVCVTSFQMTLYHVFKLAIKSSIPPSLFQLTHLLLYSTYKPSISAY